MKYCGSRFLALMILLAFVGSASAGVLVDSDWLKKNLKNPDIVIIDMSDYVQYRRYHIPGALHLPYGMINRRTKKGVSLRVSDQQLFKVLGKFGITPNHHVVIYDNLAGFNAGRLFWELERIGHKKVSVLNGGLVKWVLSGYPLDNRELLVRTKEVYIPAKNAVHRVNEIDTKSVGKLATSPSNSGTILLDVRTREEYVGYKKFPRTGHIPGARWWPWTDSFAMDKGFVFKSVPELIDSIKKVGVSKKTDPIVLYCRSGHRASQSYLTLRSLGYSNVRLYDGSILEYSKTQSMVFRKGLQP